MLNPTMRLLSIFVLALLVMFDLAFALICGNKEYDNSTETCCNGTVTSKLNLDNLYSIECCKDQTYDTRWSLCCDGVLHTDKSPDTHNCSGTNVYRLKQENGNLLTNSHLDRTTVSDDTKAKRFLRVCGVANKYDPKQNMCCNGTLYPFNVDISCCDNAVYNKRTQLCCGGQLRPRSVLNESVECCGTSPYNSKESLCCNGCLYENKNPEKYHCCGSKPYTFYKDMCCKSEVYEWSDKSLCCGNRTYNRDLQYCFNKQEILDIHESKCNGVKYDTRESVCCGDTTLHPYSNNQRCCGFEIFDRRSHDCVYHHIVTKGNSWCNTEGEYNTTTHACCEGHRKEKTGKSWLCCGKDMINYNVEDCCGGKIFNIRNHQCCSGQILKMEDVCCSGQRLNQTTQVCCGKTLFRKQEIVQKSASYHDKCCPTLGGGVSYDSVNFVCNYNDTVVNKSLLDPLCKGQRYDPKKDLCCNSKLFKNALKKGWSCCHPSASIYNSKKHVCCSGVRKKGKSCRKPRNRIRCPRRCKLKKLNLKRYCKRFLSNTGRFEVIRNIRRLIKRSKSCRCVYAERQKKACKGKQCVSIKKVIGISVEEENTTTLYIKRKKENFVKRVCKQV
ncbi:usherin-like isoform X1 [Crassostrea angulata]|uniref:usherin-like isoform X1 n=1 Tax=Magallana angulata TaxID=2784310 RepID=UPI0022B1EE2C|nr:usherin-like isoform X1 [Crassostrea angulata]